MIIYTQYQRQAISNPLLHSNTPRPPKQAENFSTIYYRADITLSADISPRLLFTRKILTPRPSQEDSTTHPSPPLCTSLPPHFVVRTRMVGWLLRGCHPNPRGLIRCVGGGVTRGGAYSRRKGDISRGGWISRGILRFCRLRSYRKASCEMGL